MMRYLMLFLLLLLLSLPSLAQDDFAMPDLPDEPIFSNISIPYALSNQFAWLDNETLVFTPYDEDFSLEDDSPYETYSYSLADNSLTLLERPLFREDWDSEWREYFQTGDNVVFRSPYSSAEIWQGVQVFYESKLFVRGGGEGGSTFIMYGGYENNPNNMPNGFYSPLDTLAFGDMRVHWSSNNQTLVMEMQVPYGQGKALFYINAGTDEHISRFGLFDYPSDQFLAFSPSGRRVAVSTHHTFDYDSNQEREQWQKLIIWEAPPIDPECHCTYHEGASHVIYSETNNNEGYRRRNFAGVGFVDENTILYIGNEGMYRHTISTGESVLLNPEFNTHWINLAIFSPDNRHMAVSTALGLYVLPTGFEG